jgi:hypothetical protein
MAVADEQGRLFGRINIFDAIVAVLILWMIPLAYAGYWLFRTPPPTLTSIEPSTIAYGPDMRVRVRGTHFAPYLRISVGNKQGRTFKFNDTTDAEVDLFDTPPGTYDVILFDNSQERDRIPNGLTITPSSLPSAQVVAVGTLGNLSAAEAATLKAGSTIPGIGVIEQVAAMRPQMQRVFARPDNVEVPIDGAQMLPAVIRLSCFIRSAQGQPECVNGFSIQPASLLFFDMFGRQVPFQIDQVRSIHPLVSVTATVRFSGEARVLSMIAAGDQDFGDIRNELSAGARVDTVGAPGGTSREARLTVQAQRGADSLLYANAPLRPGSPLVLRNSKYEVRGTVIAVEAPANDARQ